MKITLKNRRQMAQVSRRRSQLFAGPKVGRQKLALQKSALPGKVWPHLATATLNKQTNPTKAQLTDVRDPSDLIPLDRALALTRCFPAKPTGDSKSHWATANEAKRKQRKNSNEILFSLVSLLVIARSRSPRSSGELLFTQLLKGPLTRH